MNVNNIDINMFVNREKFTQIHDLLINRTFESAKNLNEAQIRIASITKIAKIKSKWCNVLFMP